MSKKLVSRFAICGIFCLAITGCLLSSVPAHAQTFTVLYDVPGAPGVQNPQAEAIAQGRNGGLYTTSVNGGNDYGTLFQFSTTGGVTVLNNVSYFAVSGATLGTDGYFYGTDQDGGPGGNCGFAGCGQVYKVSPAGVETVLYNFTGFADGADPQCALVEGTNGKFFGTTPVSSGAAISTAFSISSAGAFATLHTFTSAEGQSVTAGLIQGSDGNFYGVASAGGANGFGTIFRMTATGVVTVLHSFNSTDGNQPIHPLVQASDGNFYGTTYQGGTFDEGVAFQITPSGTYTVLHNFNPNAGDGELPGPALIQASDGKLYGTTQQGGTGYNGTIFSLTTGGTLTTLYTFTGGTDGSNPQSPLRQDTNGVFYGTTYAGGDLSTCGGIAGCGVVYSFNVGLKPFASLVTSSGIEGAKIGILGQGFSRASVVKFGGTQATAVTPTGSTFLTATVPAGALTGPVTVSTGRTMLTSTQSFAVTPTLSKFSPPSGPVGTVVTLTGTGLMQASQVTFNGTAATFTVNSDIQITATVPAGATSGKIVVTTKGGSVTSAGSFKVN